MAYPRRPRYFANRYCRLLTKTCAAQDIGHIGFVLCVTIAHLEDSKRYKGAVTFYNEQLMPLISVTKWESLDRARRRAVDIGWLHYEAGGRHQPGRYWVTIPEGLGNLDDTPCDEGQYPTKGELGGDLTEGQYPAKGELGGDLRGELGGDPSYLRPKPNPKKKDLLDSIDFPDGFDTPEVRKAITDWLAYKQRRKQTYKSPADQMTRLLRIKGDDGTRRFPTPDLFVTAVDSSIASNYAGCYPPGAGRPGGKRPSVDFSKVKTHD